LSLFTVAGSSSKTSNAAYPVVSAETVGCLVPRPANPRRLKSSRESPIQHKARWFHLTVNDALRVNEIQSQWARQRLDALRRWRVHLDGLESRGVFDLVPGAVARAAQADGAARVQQSAVDLPGAGGRPSEPRGRVAPPEDASGSAERVRPWVLPRFRRISTCLEVGHALVSGGECPRGRAARTPRQQRRRNAFSNSPPRRSGPWSGSVEGHRATGRVRWERGAARMRLFDQFKTPISTRGYAPAHSAALTQRNLASSPCSPPSDEQEKGRELLHGFILKCLPRALLLHCQRDGGSAMGGFDSRASARIKSPALRGPRFERDCSGWGAQSGRPSR
jgi:hypothetical protein